MTDTSVVKLGGSLLALPDLMDRLHHLISQQQLDRPLIIVGGGQQAEQIRLLQQRYRFDDRQAHRMAIIAMEQNARHLQRLNRKLVVAADRRAARNAWLQGKLPVLNVTAFLSENSVCGDLQSKYPNATANPSTAELPQSWDVTSDSLAAWVAARWPAAELWLIKSCDVPSPLTDSHGLAAAGLVDAFFPRVCDHRCRLNWLNLRNPQPAALQIAISRP